MCLHENNIRGGNSSSFEIFLFTCSSVASRYQTIIVPSSSKHLRIVGLLLSTPRMYHGKSIVQVGGPYRLKHSRTGIYEAPYVRSGGFIHPQALRPHGLLERPAAGGIHGCFSFKRPVVAAGPTPAHATRH